LGYGIYNYIETSNKEEQKDLNNQPAQTESAEKPSETNNPNETVSEKENTDKAEEKEKENVADIIMHAGTKTEEKVPEVVSIEEKKIEVPAQQEIKPTQKTPVKEAKTEHSKTAEKVETKKEEANKPTPVKAVKSKKPVKKVSEEKKPKKTKEPAPKKEKAPPVSRSKSLPEQTTGPNLRKNRKTDNHEYEKYANLLNQKTKRKKN
jgi:hypothetical protein